MLLPILTDNSDSLFRCDQCCGGDENQDGEDEVHDDAEIITRT